MAQPNKYRMRLNELENHIQEIPMDDSSIGPFLQKLETECSDALASMRRTHKGCFRGSNRTNTIFLGNPRTERRPLDSSRMMHHAYERLYKEHGFTATRSNSTFVTSDAKMARFYGPVYAIFPKNGFKFTWSLVSEDIAVPLDDEIKFLDVNKVYQLNAEGAKYPRNQLAFEHGMPRDTIGQPFQWDPKKNIFVNLFTAQKYHNMPVSTTDLAQSEYIDTDKLYKNFLIQDTNFDAALEAEHEIAIHGTYYGFSVRHCKDLLVNLIGAKAMGRAIRELV